MRNCLPMELNLRKGDKVWVEDKDLAWIAADVLDSFDNKLHVETSTGKKVWLTVISAELALFLLLPLLHALFMLIFAVVRFFFWGFRFLFPRKSYFGGILTMKSIMEWMIWPNWHTCTKLVFFIIYRGDMLWMISMWVLFTLFFFGIVYWEVFLSIFGVWIFSFYTSGGTLLSRISFRMEVYSFS